MYNQLSSNAHSYSYKQSQLSNIYGGKFKSNFTSSLLCMPRCFSACASKYKFDISEWKTIKCIIHKKHRKSIQKCLLFIHGSHKAGRYFRFQFSPVTLNDRSLFSILPFATPSNIPILFRESVCDCERRQVNWRIKYGVSLIILSFYYRHSFHELWKFAISHWFKIEKRNRIYIEMYIGQIHRFVYTIQPVKFIIDSA